MITILIEKQGKKILVWCETELIGEFNARCTSPHGKPLDIAKVAKQVLDYVHIESKIEMEE